MSKATSSKKNVTTVARKASEAHPTESQMIGFCVAAFADYIKADETLQNVNALFAAAREGLRIELARAFRIIKGGKAWDTFKGSLRVALVDGKVCSDTKAAGRLIINACAALGISGKGARKGGTKAGAAKRSGRPETTATGEHETLSDKAVAFRCAAALSKLAEMQTKYADDTGELLADLGEVCAILGGSK